MRFLLTYALHLQQSVPDFHRTFELRVPVSNIPHRICFLYEIFRGFPCFPVTGLVFCGGCIALYVAEFTGSIFVCNRNNKIRKQGISTCHLIMHNSISSGSSPFTFHKKIRLLQEIVQKRTPLLPLNSRWE